MKNADIRSLIFVAILQRREPVSDVNRYTHTRYMCIMHAFHFLNMCLCIDHVNEIIEVVFQYINMIRSSKPQEWIFNEIRDVSKMGFTFKGGWWLVVFERFYFYLIFFNLFQIILASHMQTLKK